MPETRHSIRGRRMMIFLLLLFSVIFFVIFFDNNFQSNKLWKLVRPMVTLATNTNDTVNVTNHVYDISVQKQLHLASPKSNISMKINSKPSTEGIVNHFLNKKTGRDPNTHVSNITTHVPNIRVVNKSIPLIDKIQQFLSSLPSQDKNSSVFDNIQNHLIKLKEQNISGLEINTKKDGHPKVGNTVTPRPKVTVQNQKATVPHPNVTVADANITVPNTKAVVPDQQKKAAEKGAENTVDRIKQSSAKKTEADNNDARPHERCDTSKYLIGKVDIKDDVKVNQVKNETALKRVKKGGSYTPSDCIPGESVAIIIPYRDRQKHLEIFVNYMHAFLQRQQLQYGIFVVELARPTIFNRGLLANVGFLAAQSTDLYNCYVIHDVDLLPLNDKNIYNCSEKFRHLSAANSKFGYSVPYSAYAGGVIALREDVYVNINGFSNLYFGWGGEDDDVWQRANAQKYTMDRPAKSVGVYQALKHGHDALNPDNPKRFQQLRSGLARRHDDGINSMNYQTLLLTATDLYTLVYVRVEQNVVMWTEVIGKVNGIQIYQSDLNTLTGKHAINDKIVNSYLWTLYEGNKDKVVCLKSTFKYQKEPIFPPDLNSSKMEFLFIPVKSAGHWALIVVYPKQLSIAYLDPVGNYSNKEIDVVRRFYSSQFSVELTENKDLGKAITHEKNENESGLLILMYAKKILEGKSLIFEQAELDAARKDIESSLRRR